MPIISVTHYSSSNDWHLNEVKFTEKEIGCGTFGRVFEVEYEGTVCAAKEIHSLSVIEFSQQHDKVVQNSILNECQIWSTLHHPCIIQFIGLLIYS